MKNILTKLQRDVGLRVQEDDHTICIVDLRKSETVATFTSSTTIQTIRQAANDYLYRR